MRDFFLIVVLISLGLMSSGDGYAFTRNQVEKRGFLRCGVSMGMPGFSIADSKGNWSGVDVDICRAVAAAVLDDGTKVQYVPLLPRERAISLLAGEIDILSRNMVWDLTKDSSLSMHFVAITFFDQQGFLVAAKNTIKSIMELKDFNACMLAGTDDEEILEDYLHESGLKFKAVFSETPENIVKDFEADRCEVITGGRAQLQGIRSRFPDPAAVVFLPEIIGNEPLGPAVRQGDDEWFDIVKWTIFAMIKGEELALTSANIDSMESSPNRAVQKFLGGVGIGGKGLGLTDDWAYRIIKQVGNYGESFEKNLGQSSPLKLQRGFNAPWNSGGLLFAPPLR